MAESRLRRPDPSLLERVGNTPLRRLEGANPYRQEGIEIHAKLEWENPGGSVKDRAAKQIILDGIARGELTRQKTILDSSSGNTGISLAMIGAALGYTVLLVVPTSTSPEKKRLMRQFGAEILYTPLEEGSDGAQRKAIELYREAPQRYFYANQYDNPGNARAHSLPGGTADEIWTQTGGRITDFIAGVGTAGTFCGTTRRLREHNPRIKAWEVQPDSEIHHIEGLKFMARSIRPGIYDEKLATGRHYIRTEEAWDMVNDLRKTEYIRVGASSAANLVATLRRAKELHEKREKGVLVTLFPDSIQRYAKLSRQMMGETK